MGSNEAKDLYKLLFGVRRSIRYHTRRRLFFDRLNKFSTFLAALAGTATVASVLAKCPRPWTVAFAVAVTVFSVIDLVIGTAQASRLHHDLAKQFIDLEKDLISLQDPSQEDIKRLTGRRLDIEQNEPPPLKVLDSICHNELLRAMNYSKDYFVQIKWYQRLLSQFMDVREYNITKLPTPNEKSG